MAPVSVERRPVLIEGFGPSACPGAPHHQRRVRRDPVEPCRETRLAAKPRQVAVHSKEGLLQDVLGVGAAPGQPAGQAVDPRLIASDEELERGVVARASPARQLLVALLQISAP
jgi:hypothetical protein